MTITIPRVSGRDLILTKDRERRPAEYVRNKCMRLGLRWRYLGTSRHGYHYFELSIPGLAGEDDRVVNAYLDHGRLWTWLDGWEAAMRASNPI
jgi:hypothetical protein